MITVLRRLKDVFCFQGSLWFDYSIGCVQSTTASSRVDACVRITWPFFVCPPNMALGFLSPPLLLHIRSVYRMTNACRSAFSVDEVSPSTTHFDTVVSRFTSIDSFCTPSDKLAFSLSFFCHYLAPTPFTGANRTLFFTFFDCRKTMIFFPFPTLLRALTADLIMPARQCRDTFLYKTRNHPNFPCH